MLQKHLPDCFQCRKYPPFLIQTPSKYILRLPFFTQTHIKHIFLQLFFSPDHIIGSKPELLLCSSKKLLVCYRRKYVGWDWWEVVFRATNHFTLAFSYIYNWEAIVSMLALVDCYSNTEGDFRDGLKKRLRQFVERKGDLLIQNRQMKEEL